MVIFLPAISRDNRTFFSETHAVRKVQGGTITYFLRGMQPHNSSSMVSFPVVNTLLIGIKRFINTNYICTDQCAFRVKEEFFTFCGIYLLVLVRSVVALNSDQRIRENSVRLWRFYYNSD